MNLRSVLGSVDQLVRSLGDQFGDSPKLLRVGISRSIGLSYLPGFFAGQCSDDVLTDVHYESSQRLLELLLNGSLEVAMVTATGRLPRGITKTHHFVDGFTVITPPDAMVIRRSAKLLSLSELRRNAENQRWILPSESTGTGGQLRGWLDRCQIPAVAAVQTANLDLIVNLVSLGMGWGIVPLRALPLYARRRVVKKVPLRERFERDILVVTRANSNQPGHVTQFVDGILF